MVLNSCTMGCVWWWRHAVLLWDADGAACCGSAHSRHEHPNTATAPHCSLPTLQDGAAHIQGAGGAGWSHAKDTAHRMDHRGQRPSGVGLQPLCSPGDRGARAVSTSCPPGCEVCSKRTKGQEFNWFEQMAE